MSANPTPLGRPTPSRRGWAVIGGSVGIVVGGLIIGRNVLAGLGASGVLLVLFAHLMVLRERPKLTIRRVANPSRLHVGAECRVTIEGRTLARTPLLMLTEMVDGGLRVARFAVPPGPRDTPLRATYRVPTTRRGRHELGPLLAFVIDRFGLARRAWEVAAASDLIVRPRIHPIQSPRRGHGGEPELDAQGKRLLTHQTAAEFLALREYEPGDDPRRVNWRATARRDELMVRQDEAASPGRLVLVLDVRPDVYDEASFETAVEAAASVAVQTTKAQIPLEAVTTTGDVLGRPVPGALELLLDHLAVIDPGGPDHLTALCAQLTTRLGVGGVVVVTGRPDGALGRAVAPLHGRCVLAVVGTRPPEPGVVIPGLVDASSAPFAAAWDRGVALTGRRRGARPIRR